MDYNKSKAIPLKFVKDNPIAAATISKLTAGKQGSSKINPLYTNIQDISVSTAEKIASNEDIVRLFPDIELAIQIMTSSILSPNDMLTTNLTYDIPTLRLPPEVKQTVTTIIKDYIYNIYDLESALYTILREAMFTKGAYIEAIIPESALDDIINRRISGQVDISKEDMDKLERIRNRTPYLGSVNISNFKESKIGHESYGFIKEDYLKSLNKNNLESSFNINITDDLSILNKGKKIYSEKSTISRTNLGLETNQVDLEVEQILDSVFKQPEFYNREEMISIPTQNDASRPTLGRPLVIKLPTESVIPVYATSNPSKHLGYFLLVDQNGSPLNPTDETNDLQNRLRIDPMSTSRSLANKATWALNGMTKPDPTLADMGAIYNNIVEKLIKEKLRTGLYGDLVDLKDNADIYNVMFLRSLANMETRLLFIPAELVQYYAFEYRENGTGKSLMEKASIQYSIRAILLFSKLMANIKNSINTTTVTATLDETLQDPQTIMEKITAETFNSRAARLPIGLHRTDDILEWVSTAGINFVFKHPELPDMDIQKEEGHSDYTVPDDELDAKIRESIIMSFGLTPEIVESGYNTDFATTVVAKNLLFAKRILQLQKKLSVMVTEHVVKLITNDAGIKSTLESVISNSTSIIKKFYNKIKNKDKEDLTEEDSAISKVKDKELTSYLIDKILKDLYISFPKPETNEADTMKSAFDAYKESIENYTDLIFSTDAISDKLVGPLSEDVDLIKSALKSALIRNWMNTNGYLPEISNFLTKDENGKPTFDALIEHIEFLKNVSDATADFCKKAGKAKASITKKIEKAHAAMEGNSDSDSDNDNENEEGENNDGDNTESASGSDTNDSSTNDSDNPNDNTSDGDASNEQDTNSEETPDDMGGDSDTSGGSGGGDNSPSPDDSGMDNEDTMDAGEAGADDTGGGDIGGDDGAADDFGVPDTPDDKGNPESRFKNAKAEHQELLVKQTQLRIQEMEDKRKAREEERAAKEEERQLKEEERAARKEEKEKEREEKEQERARKEEEKAAKEEEKKAEEEAKQQAKEEKEQAKEEENLAKESYLETIPKIDPRIFKF